MALMEVAVTLTEWRVTSTSGTRRSKSSRGPGGGLEIPRSAGRRRACYWSLFPTEQTFSATDYGWVF